MLMDVEKIYSDSFTEQLFFNTFLSILVWQFTPSFPKLATPTLLQTFLAQSKKVSLQFSTYKAEPYFFQHMRRSVPQHTDVINKSGYILEKKTAKSLIQLA